MASYFMYVGFESRMIGKINYYKFKFYSCSSNFEINKVMSKNEVSLCTNVVSFEPSLSLISIIRDFDLWFGAYACAECTQFSTAFRHPWQLFS